MDRLYNLSSFLVLSYWCWKIPCCFINYDAFSLQHSSVGARRVVSDISGASTLVSGANTYVIDD